MDSEENIRPGQPCGFENCDSTRYHLNDSGVYECDNGHMHPEMQEQHAYDEDDAYGAAERGRKSRTESASETSEKMSRQLKGRAGFEMYLLCYQLILRKQCYGLVHSKGFPEEFETVTRDLWTLRLPHMADRVDEITTMKSDSESQSQLFSSQSDDENAVESEATTIGQKARSLKPKKFPQLIDTLALCYLAALLLRLPVLPGDLHSWVANGELLYHGSLKSIPVDMTVRLPATYKSVLEPKIILQRDKLQKAITDVALEYQHNIGIRFPPINFPLVCLRCVKELALPLDMYPSVARLARLVNYNFTFPDMEHTRYARKTSLPMDQLAALLVVATKLSYPFDGKPRVPKSATEPAALVIDWAKWNEIMSGQPEKNRSKSRKSKRKSSKSGKPFGFAEAMAVKESDVMNMSRDQMDKYLDWYGQVWTSNEVIAHEKDAEFRKEMLAMFPVDTSKEAEPWGEGVQDVEDDLITARLQAVMASLKIREPVSDADADHGINRPGSYYKQWRREEDLTEYGKQFAEAVSKLVGVSLERLIRVVFQTEMKLRVWIKEQED